MTPISLYSAASFRRKGWSCQVAGVGSKGLSSVTVLRARSAVLRVTRAEDASPGSSRSFLDKLIFLVFALVGVVLGWVRRITHVIVWERTGEGRRCWRACPG